jgi:2,4-dienoyl-CoA reductase-like NADH-dependent reductase (Old Yellow Enzyme family)
VAYFQTVFIFIKKRVKNNTLLTTIMSVLFSSYNIRDIAFKNRIFVSPMCEYSSTDGFANDWHLVHLGSRAVGGASLVIAEATAVSPEGRITPDDLGIWKNEHLEQLKRITDFIKLQQAVPGIQLAHAGRKASRSAPWKGNALLDMTNGGWQTVAPSALPFYPKEAAPASLDQHGINKVITDFKAAAKRALEAGFEVIEIHGAHGYLINEFMSPLANKRTDNYGGNFENRIRLLLEIVSAIREEWPKNLPLFVRISSSDWSEGGWTIEDSVSLATILKNKEVDLIDCSSGGVVPDAVIPAGPGYQVPFSEIIRKRADILTGAVGIIITAQQAEEIISSGKADFVLLAREFLRDPYFPLHAARELEQDVLWPVQYERAKRK